MNEELKKVMEVAEVWTKEPFDAETRAQVKAMLRAEGANSSRVAGMLYKPRKQEYNDAKPDYIGHEIADEFVVGYGLDFDGYARNLDAVYKVKK